jgi:hypothetical protein
MVADFCDDLNALDAPTSEINFRSDADELDEYLEDEDLDMDTDSEDESGSGDQSEDEEDETALQLVEVNDQIRKLHAECLKLGITVFKTMKQQIQEAKRFILPLRDNIFRYRQGSSGNVIAFSDDMLGMNGKPLGKLSWPQYCERVFDLSTKRISQILGATDKSVKKTIKPNCEKSLWRNGWHARSQQVENWIRAQKAAGTVFATDVSLPSHYTDVVKAPFTKLLAESAAEDAPSAPDQDGAEDAELAADETSVICFFARYKKNPAEMVAMLRLILRTYGLANNISIETAEVWPQ